MYMKNMTAAMQHQLRQLPSDPGYDALPGMHKNVLKNLDFRAHGVKIGMVIWKLLQYIFQGIGWKLFHI